MKIRLLLLILIILPTLCFGQYYSKEYDFNTGEAYPVVDAPHKYYFSKGDEILMLKKSDKKIIIQKYDVIKKKEVAHTILPPLVKGAVFDEIVELQDKYYLFYSLWDKKNELEQLFYMRINFENSTLEEPESIIKYHGKLAGMFGAVNDGPSFAYTNMGVTNKFKFSKSFDESKLVIQYRKKPTTRKDSESFDVIGMHVFNQDLSEIWSDEFKMPYSEAGMNNIDFDVDGKGNAYMLTEVFESSTPRKYIKEKKNYHLELIKISEKGLLQTKLTEEDYYINSVWMFEASNGNIYLAGYYNEEVGYSSSVEGLFVKKLDGDCAVESSSYHKIPSEIINQNQSKRTKKKNDKKEEKGDLDFENLYLDKIIIGDDGSVVLMGEQFFVTSTTDSKGRTKFYYNYNDILVAKIDKDGQLAWMKKLPKRQRGSSSLAGLSYKHLYQDGHHYFFVLDHVRNMELGTDEVPASLSSGKIGIFTSHKISHGSGEHIKESIVDIRQVKMNGYDEPRAIHQFSVNRIIETSNGIVFEAYKKDKQDVMIHVEFE